MSNNRYRPSQNYQKTFSAADNDLNWRRKKPNQKSVDSAEKDHLSDLRQRAWANDYASRFLTVFVANQDAIVKWKQYHGIHQDQHKHEHQDDKLSLPLFINQPFNQFSDKFHEIFTSVFLQKSFHSNSGLDKLEIFLKTGFLYYRNYNWQSSVCHSASVIQSMDVVTCFQTIGMLPSRLNELQNMLCSDSDMDHSTANPAENMNDETSHVVIDILFDNYSNRHQQHIELYYDFKTLRYESYKVSDISCNLNLVVGKSNVETPEDFFDVRIQSRLYSEDNLELLTGFKEETFRDILSFDETNSKNLILNTDWLNNHQICKVYKLTRRLLPTKLNSNVSIDILLRNEMPYFPIGFRQDRSLKIKCGSLDWLVPHEDRSKYLIYCYAKNIRKIDFYGPTGERNVAAVWSSLSALERCANLTL